MSNIQTLEEKYYLDWVSYIGAATYQDTNGFVRNDGIEGLVHEAIKKIRRGLEEYDDKARSVCHGNRHADPNHQLEILEGCLRKLKPFNDVLRILRDQQHRAEKALPWKNEYPEVQPHF